ncbi:LmeA family phospholipid-binding protein [Glycomyces harbinensis]|uniref:DUF2993 domain-containing protein n=1 Tax=Glycomyces harbinensis TaxID=58114 RepID=A0A1G6Y6Z0_9ACTN|nr:DUF2993 domain-containing protein [Glycomyces harbinensis]SDD85356.1 Protein of unknown function [Glycomyces harbinensis]
MKIFRRVLIVLVIVVALAALGDRVANALAEGRIADEVAATAADNGAYSDQRPEVTIHGWPFATQAWSGEFEQIDIDLRDVGAEGLVFPSLAMEARDVAADWRELADGGDAVAGTLDVSGSISVASIEALMAEQTGFDLAIDEEGVATVTSTEEVGGVSVDLQATGAIEVGEGELRFTPDAVESLTSGLPEQIQPLIDDYAAQLTTSVTLPELPYGIQLVELAFEGDEVVISGSAEDVVLT